MKRVIPLIATLALAACGGGTQLSLSGRAGGTLAPQASPTALTLSNGVTVDRLRAVIVVEGQIDGQPYTFISGVDADERFQGSFSLASGDNNVTLNLDPSTWFGGSGSARLDPRMAGNQSAIENNIQASMKVFDDDDRDGRPDHL